MHANCQSICRFDNYYVLTMHFIPQIMFWFNNAVPTINHVLVQYSSSYSNEVLVQQRSSYYKSCFGSIMNYSKKGNRCVVKCGYIFF